MGSRETASEGPTAYIFAFVATTSSVTYSIVIIITYSVEIN